MQTQKQAESRLFFLFYSFLASISSFLQTMAGAQTGHYTRQADMISLSLCLSLAPIQTHSVQPRRFLCLWMKEEVQRRLKCKESSVSSVSLRQDWHHSRQQQQQQRQWQAPQPNYSWGLKNATAKSLVSTKLTHSAACVFSKASPLMSYNLKLTPSMKRFPSQWRPPGLRKEGATLKRRVSKCLFSNLVEKFAQVELCCRTRQLCVTPELRQRPLETPRAGGRRASHP